MINEEAIKSYLRTIPPLPEVLQKSIEKLNAGDLPGAGKIAGTDPALLAYFKEIISKPFFGFSGQMNDMVQIFGALGILQVDQILKSYLIQLIRPKEWSFFKFDNAKFQNLQAEVIAEWSRIEKAMQIADKEVPLAITLLPATIIVCEQLFAEHKLDVQILRETKQMDFDTILKRLTGMGFFQIAIVIGRKWGLPDRSLKFLMLSSGENKFANVNPQNLKIAQCMHLFFFMILSRNPYMEAGMNEFIAFKPEFVEPVMEEFMQVAGIA